MLLPMRNFQSVRDLSRRQFQVYKQRNLQKEYIDLQNTEDLEFTIEVLQAEEKTKNDIQYLQRAFYQLQFFEDKRKLLREEVYLSLFRTLKHKHLKRDEVVFNYGDEGETFYIILRGQATVLLPKPIIVQQIENNTLTHHQLQSILKANMLEFAQRIKKSSKQPRQVQERQSEINERNKHSVEFTARLSDMKTRGVYFRRATIIEQLVKKDLSIRPPSVQELSSDDQLSLSMISSSSEECVNKSNTSREHVFYDEYLRQVYGDFVRLKNLQAGQAFGEIALVTKSKRTATIICQEDCDFITLTRESFTRILGESEQLMMEQKVNFFKSFDCFERVPNSKLMSAIHQMITITPNLYQVLYKENEKSDRVYFILEGDVEISQTAAMSNTPKRNPQPRILVSVLTKGGMFGHDDVMKGTLRQSKAVSKSRTSEIYSLHANIFIELLKLYAGQNSIEGSLERLHKYREKHVETNKRTNILVSNEMSKLSAPKLIQTVNSTNIRRQQYEEMTRLKIANDAKLLCEAKGTVERKLKTIASNSLRSILNPIDASKQSRRVKQQTLHTSKDLIAADTYTSDTLKSIDNKPVSRTLQTPLNLIDQRIHKGGFIYQILSPEERSLLSQQRQVRNIESSYHFHTRNNYLSQFQLGETMSSNTPSETLQAHSRSPSNISIMKGITKADLQHKHTLSGFAMSPKNGNIHLVRTKDYRKADRAMTIANAMTMK